MTDREVMQQALEALEAKGDAWIVLERKAIISLRAALAETTQEQYDYRFIYDRPCYKCKSVYCPANCKDTPQPEQQAEPVAWAVQGCSKMWRGEFAWLDAKAEAERIGGTCVAYALYTTPPAAQRPWVELTDEDLEFWTEELGQGELGRGVIRAVADHLKERNT